jgi:hypothetical protein
LPLEIVGIEYPSPKSVELGFAEGTLAVYEGEIVIRAQLRLSEKAVAGKSGTLRLKTTYQACNDSACLSPASRDLMISLTVGENGKR